MASFGKIATGAAGGAAAGSVLGPWGTAGGAVVGGVLGALSGDGGSSSNAAPQAAPAQFGAGNGSELTNQLAAQQYAEGLRQQQGQNSREAAFYNQGNTNFGIANAAQMRGPQQISSSLQDKQNQLAALQGIGNSGTRLNQTGDRLTALGTQPMGPSYAEAQLRQGQDAAMAQQLSMAHSGRSLGSGQAAMNQAAFANAGINQQTNQAAASARIQEQNAYNNFQAGALGSAGQQYGAAGSMSGLAGQQASGIRQGNENVQLQNANLGLQQQGANNQTTGLYNQLGAQQQQLGMQANQLGTNAFQFGAGQAQGMQQAQLNANVGQTSSSTATNLANQQNSNLHDAANANASAAALAQVPQIVGALKGPPAPAPAPAPARVPTAAPAAPISSDENNKKNIKPVVPPGDHFSSDHTGHSADDPTDLQAIAAKNQIPAGYYQTPTYAQAVGEMSNAYAPSQNAPADVLWHKPGAGAPASGSQADLLNFMRAGRAGPGEPPRAAPELRAAAAGASTGRAASLADVMAARQPAPTPAPAQPGQSQWGDVFNTPQLSPAVQAYLNGATPIHQAAPAAAPTASSPLHYTPGVINGNDVLQGEGPPPFTPATDNTLSDVHSKTRIQDLESQLAALRGGPPTASFAPQSPDTGALDAAYSRQSEAPAVDLTAARGYSYDYKNPSQPGATHGTQVGPMAQDLEHTAAAATVHNTPTGKVVDAPRLTMVNTAAISELQRKMERLEALGGGQAQPPPYQASLYPAAQGY